jgi:hypothetical protein
MLCQVAFALPKKPNRHAVFTGFLNWLDLYNKRWDDHYISRTQVLQSKGTKANGKSKLLQLDLLEA